MVVYFGDDKTYCETDAVDCIAKFIIIITIAVPILKTGSSRYPTLIANVIKRIQFVNHESSYPVYIANTMLQEHNQKYLALGHNFLISSGNPLSI